MSDPHPRNRCEVRDWYEPIDSGTTALIANKPPVPMGLHHHHGLVSRHHVPSKARGNSNNDEAVSSIQPVRGPIGQEARVCYLHPPLSGRTPYYRSDWKPDEKPVGDNDVIRDFARKAAGWGLPSGFLFPVADSYKLNILRDEDDSSDRATQYEFAGKPLRPRLNLHRSVLDTLKSTQLGINPIDTNAVGTLYHEATHAYMMLHQTKEPLKSVQSSAQEYYKDALLVGGGVVDEPLRALREAAGEYVEDRLAGCFNALHTIAVQVRAGTRSGKPFTVEKLAAIRKEYNHTMQKSLFGGSWGDKQVASPLPASLKKYLDTEILEGKIPDSFDDCKVVRDLLMQSGYGILLNAGR
jgi:hypothetical protein